MSRPVQWRDQMAFGHGPFENAYYDDGIWTDISDDVRRRSGSMSSGRSSAGAAHEPSAMTLTLDNSSRGGKTPGRYTPGYNAGPYHPLEDGVPYRRQYSLDGGDTWLPAWAGFAKSWKASFDGGDPVAQVTVTQRTALPGQQTLPPVLAAELMQFIVAKGAQAIWRLDDPADAELAQDSAPQAPAYEGSEGGNPLLPVHVGNGGAIDFGAGEAPGPDDLRAVAFTPASAADYSYLRSQNPLTDQFWTVSAFVRPETPPSGVTYSTFVGVNSGGNWLSVGWDGTYFWVLLNAAGVPSAWAHLTPAAAGAWHHIALIKWVERVPTPGGYDEVPHFDLMVDGAITPVGAAAGMPAGHVTVGAGFSSSSMFGGSEPAAGQVSHVAILASDYEGIPAQFLETIGKIGLGTHTETAAEAFFRAGRYGLGVPEAAGWLTAAGEFTQQLTPVPTNDRKLADVWADIETAEQGRITVGPRGEIELRSRAAMHAQTEPVITLSADQFNVTDAFFIDDSGVVNDQRGQRRKGGEQRVRDIDSIAARGARSASPLTLDVPTDADALAVLQWIVGTRAAPGVAVPGVRMTAAALDRHGILADVLACGEGDRVRLTGLPDGAPWTFTDAIIGKVEIEPGDAIINWTLEPFVPVFIAEDDEFGRAADDPGSMTLDQPLEAGDDFAVITIIPGKVHLTENPADYPLDVSINGERVRLAMAETGAQTLLVGDYPIVAHWRPEVGYLSGADAQALFITERGIAPTTETDHAEGEPVAVWNPAVAGI